MFNPTASLASSYAAYNHSYDAMGLLANSYYGSNNALDGAYNPYLLGASPSRSSSTPTSYSSLLGQIETPYRPQFPLMDSPELDWNPALMSSNRTPQNPQVTRAQLEKIKKLEEQNKQLERKISFPVKGTRISYISVYIVFPALLNNNTSKVKYFHY